MLSSLPISLGLACSWLLCECYGRKEDTFRSHPAMHCSSPRLLLQRFAEPCDVPVVPFCCGEWEWIILGVVSSL